MRRRMTDASWLHDLVSLMEFPDKPRRWASDWFFMSGQACHSYKDSHSDCIWPTFSRTRNVRWLTPTWHRFLLPCVFTIRTKKKLWNSIAAPASNGKIADFQISSRFSIRKVFRKFPRCCEMPISSWLRLIWDFSAARWKLEDESETEPVGWSLFVVSHWGFWLWRPMPAASCWLAWRSKQT